MAQSADRLSDSISTISSPKDFAQIPTINFINEEDIFTCLIVTCSFTKLIEKAITVPFWKGETDICRNRLITTDIERAHNFHRFRVMSKKPAWRAKGVRKPALLHLKSEGGDGWHKKLT
jgi:hypothetical protein